MDLQEARKLISKDHQIYERLMASLPVSDLDYVRRQVMDISEVPYPTYHNTVSGKVQNPNIKILKALSMVLKCSIDDLLNPDYEFRPLKQSGRDELAASLGLSREAA